MRSSILCLCLFLAVAGFAQQGHDRQPSLEFLRELHLDRLQGETFVSAASGLVRVSGSYFVVDDDSLSLSEFTLDPSRRGRPIPLFRRPAYHGDKDARKKVKPDLESLALVEFEGSLGLLAFGSGSSPQRRKGVYARLTQSHRICQIVEFDLEPLYRHLQSEIPNLNIEGLAPLGDRLRVLHRGNSAKGSNVLIELDLNSVMRAAQRGLPISSETLLSRREISLGHQRGVPWTFTDLAPLEQGRSLFLAAAEDTQDPYHDGEILGSAVGILEADGTVSGFRVVSQRLKFEGVDVRADGGRYTLTLVTDADDASRPAEMYQLVVEL